MTVILELPPEIEAQVVKQAAARGLTTQKYLQNLIAERAAAPIPMPDDWENSLDELTIAGAELPVLPEAAFERASFYQERD